MHLYLNCRLRCRVSTVSFCTSGIYRGMNLTLTFRISCMKGYNDAQFEKSKQRQNKIVPREASAEALKGEPATVAQITAESKGKARPDSSPVTKRARRSLAEGEPRAGTSSDEDGNTSEEDDGNAQDEEDEQDEDEGVDVSSGESEEDEVALQEDLVEEKNNEEDADNDEILEGHESD